MKKAITIIAVGAVILVGINFATDYFKQDTSMNQYKHHRKIEHKMQKMKKQLSKQLNLSEEQQKKVDELHAKGKQEMMPLIKELRFETKKLLRLLEEDTDMTVVKEQQEKVKALRENIKSVKETHMKLFEEILNDEQKIEFKKIKVKMIQRHKILKESGLHQVY